MSKILPKTHVCIYNHLVASTYKYYGVISDGCGVYDDEEDGGTHPWNQHVTTVLVKKTVDGQTKSEQESVIPKP